MNLNDPMMSHDVAVYYCPGCLNTMHGCDLYEKRARYSIRRRTWCCNETPVLGTPELQSKRNQEQGFEALRPGQAAV